MQWDNTFKVLNEKTLPTKNPMSKKLYFKNQSQIHFQMNKTENLLLADPPYKKILKEALQAKSK